MKLRTIGVLLTLVAMVSAQNGMRVLTSGGNEDHLLDDITRVTFTATSMLVEGVGQFYDMNDIEKIVFADITNVGKGAPQEAQRDPLRATHTPRGTHISLDLKEPSRISMRVYSVGGELVKTLVEGMHSAGNYKVTWNGSDTGGRKVATGVYTVHIDINSHTTTRRVIIAR